MRTTEIGFWTNDSEIVRFNLVGPDVRNPYTIKSIAGLDAEEIVPQYYASGLVSGNKFNELALNPREIVVRIDMKPNYRANQHPADLRGKLLKAIASSRTGTVQMRFYSGGVCWGAITGFITKFESPVTARDTEVQFTIRCDDPIIRSLTVTSQIVSELDVDDPILTDPISTSPHGFKFKLTFSGSVNPFIIADPGGDWNFQIDYAFLSGDELYFSSEFGDKYLFRVRSAVTLNLMDTLDQDSIWPMLFPGENVFDVNTASFDWDEVYWYETHWGIYMDFFKFIKGADPSYLTDGQAINGIKKAMWAERYVELGEFEFRAPESSLLNLILPVGTIVSHVASQEPMMVTRIELDDGVKDSENEWVITGNSLESYFKNRIIGDDIETYVFAGERLLLSMDVYTLAFDTSWAQTVQMIKDHLSALFNIPNDEVAGWDIISNEQHTVTSPITEARTIKPQTLYSAVQELLAIDDFGIKVVRPNAGNVDPTKTEFRVHNGLDLRDSVIFSHAFGDLEKTKYFWSEEALKTEYYCISTYYRLRSDDGPAGFPRRVLLVDCSDMDGHLNDTDAVDGPTVALLGHLMDIRGQQALRAWNSSDIITTNISRTTQYKYRTDYNVGDIVSVRANYDTEAIKRVTEYVEFQDENGESGYPTLSALNE